MMPGRSHRKSLGTEGRAAGAVCSGPLVCVIDGDERLRQRLNTLLQTLDIAIEAFSSAEDFLDTRRCDQPDCLIVEVQLPGMSGIELQHRLRARGADYPVIVVASKSDIATAVNAMQLGAFDFIEKPFINSVILDLVRKALQLPPRRLDCPTRRDPP